MDLKWRGCKALGNSFVRDSGSIMPLFAEAGLSPATNLLVNCARLSAGERLLVLIEDAASGHYCAGIGPAVADAAREMGVHVQTETVSFQPVVTHIEPHIEEAMAAADCTIFFARLGDQIRFCGFGDGKRAIVSYALDLDALKSPFGQADHRAFVALKQAIDRLVGLARSIHVTCPRGTDFTGPGKPELLSRETDVAVTRFPMSVFAPVPVEGYRGRAVMTRFITGTCSRFYTPFAAPLDGHLTAHFEDNRLTGFTGLPDDVARANAHYDHVSGMFGLDRNFIHSWHAGIHPGCAYRAPAEENYERWCSGAFGNPRILHFHTCGAFAPGEISWNILDPTIRIDGVSVWENGVLHVDRVPGGAEILDTYPTARLAFEAPAQDVGL